MGIFFIIYIYFYFFFNLCSALALQQKNIPYIIFEKDAGFGVRKQGEKIYFSFMT